MKAPRAVMAWVILAAEAIPSLARAGDEQAAPAADAAKQKAEAEARSQAAPAADAAKQKSEAQAHFERGLALADKGAYEPALAEYRRSVELYPTRAAMKNAAVCLRWLKRHDEALDQYEALFRTFRELPEPLKSEAQRAVVELLPLVGALVIDGAEPGAVITVDGRRRGEHPLLSPLRLGAGSHVVRVYREGFEPFEAGIEIAGGQTARMPARLARLVQAGRLRVAEKGGKALDVVVDGNVVGVTPWEGPIAVGDHAVMLRGEDRFGAPPSPVSIRAGARADLVLAAEELDAAMGVVPVPAEASVAIDGLFVGRGTWDGRVRPGAHRVDLVADGYLKAARSVTLARGGRGMVAATLDRDPRSKRWQRPGRFLLEVGGGAALSPSFGALGNGCSKACAQPLGAGGYGLFHGGYELGSGFGFGVEAGYLRVQQATTGRATSIQAVGRAAPSAGTADDTRKLRTFLAGAWAGLGAGGRLRLRVRLGAGVALGTLSDTRTGTFTAQDGARFDVGPLIQAPSTTWFYLAPEVRLGVRLGGHVELSAGVAGLTLIGLSPRRWDATQPVRAGDDGYGTFAADPLVAPVILALTPGLSARYDF